MYFAYELNFIFRIKFTLTNITNQIHHSWYSAEVRIAAEQQLGEIENKSFVPFHPNFTRCHLNEPLDLTVFLRFEIPPKRYDFFWNEGKCIASIHGLASQKHN